MLYSLQFVFLVRFRHGSVATLKRIGTKADKRDLSLKDYLVTLKKEIEDFLGRSENKFNWMKNLKKEKRRKK